MAELAPRTELLRSLGSLVRGLSALFWGLPLALLVCVKTALSDWLKPLGMFPPILVTGLLFYGLLLLREFQKQERVWRSALDRATILGLANFGLSPFIYWWNRLPQSEYYAAAVGILALSGLLFLFNLNQVLQRLAAMLPDETLRHETRLFTAINLYIVIGIVMLSSVYLAAQQWPRLPFIFFRILALLEFAKQWLLIFVILVPLAMTMTLIWKIKEAIFHSVFGPDSGH